MEQKSKKALNRDLNPLYCKTKRKSIIITNVF